MERKHKITIPEPCHENWDKMTQKDNGRFCLSCSKTVVDFTTMLPHEVQHFFVQNQNTNICGRFKNSQLDTITIQIPSQVLYTQTHYPKMFLLALFIAMGTTLFSCQDKSGNKQKIDKVEVVEENVLEKNTTTGKALRGKNQIPPPPLPPTQKDTKKCSETPKVTMGVIIPKKLPFEYDIVYNSKDLDVLPAPKNGMKEFYAFFNKNYTLSNQENLSVLFVIEKDGSLSNFKILKNISKESGEEAIRILKTAPNWIPGKLNNRIVRSSYILPISFKK